MSAELRLERIEVHPLCGTSIHRAVEQAIDLAAQHDCEVTFDFNDIKFTVNGDTRLDHAIKCWDDIKRARRRARSASVGPEDIRWGE